MCSGILSAWGVGGGTLLLIFMTVFQSISPIQARGINLLYFLPTASASLLSHTKNGFIDKRAFLITALAGVPAALAASMAASGLDTALSRRLFGIFLIICGVREFFRKSP